jgi:hypothetical protein
MARRAQAAFAGVDLAPIDPINLRNRIWPAILKTQLLYASRGQLRRTADEAPPYGLSNGLFNLVGITDPARRPVENAEPNFHARYMAQEARQRNLAIIEAARARNAAARAGADGRAWVRDAFPVGAAAAAPQANLAAAVAAQAAALGAAPPATAVAMNAGPALLNYNSLPNNGNVPVSGNDPIDFEEFEK